MEGSELTDGYACEEGTFRHRHGRISVPRKFRFSSKRGRQHASRRHRRIDSDDDDVYAVDIVGFTINRSPAIVHCGASRIGRSRDLSLTFGWYTRLCLGPKGLLRHRGQYHVAAYHYSGRQ